MIVSKSQAIKYQTLFTNGQQTSMSDTTIDKGGGNAGFRPHELLEAALACCMNMTLRMSAEKHKIPITEVSVEVKLNRTNPEKPVFEYRVLIVDPLQDSEKATLLHSLENCPVRSTLSSTLSFINKGSIN
jgi:putative redox protein